MSSCNGNCSSCGSDCADRKAESLLAKLNPRSSVKTFGPCSGTYRVPACKQQRTPYHIKGFVRD